MSATKGQTDGHAGSFIIIDAWLVPAQWFVLYFGVRIMEAGAESLSRSPWWLLAVLCGRKMSYKWINSQSGHAGKPGAVPLKCDPDFALFGLIFLKLQSCSCQLAVAADDFWWLQSTCFLGTMYISYKLVVGLSYVFVPFFTLLAGRWMSALLDCIA